MKRTLVSGTLVSGTLVSRTLVSGALAALRVDCVDGGASVGFMSPLAHECAVAFRMLSCVGENLEGCDEVAE